jgi:hypothetical protein
MTSVTRRACTTLGSSMRLGSSARGILVIRPPSPEQSERSGGRS